MSATATHRQVQGCTLFRDEQTFYTFAAHTFCPHYVQVTQAVCQQLATLNTNSRYLHADLTTYTSELLATLPPSLQVSGGA